MNKWIKFIFSHLIFLLFVTGLQADVNGLVFRDLAVDGTALNTYGSKDSNELGVAGVTVTAYYDGGTSTTTTGADGTWSIATTSDVRVEFSDWPIYLNESPNTANNIAVQFVSDGDTSVDFALHEPSDYSDTATPDYILGRQQTGISADNSQPGVETVHYTDSELNSDFCDENGDQGTGPVPTVSAEVKDVGSAWGQAFQKDKQRLFLSASLQRHVGLTSVGLGRVSILDYSAGVNSVTNTYIDLQGVTPANGGADIDLGTVCRAASCSNDGSTSSNTGIAADYTLPDNASDPSIDLDAYAKVGKMSFGDIDFDQTTNTLWLVNLNQKGIISVDASGDLSNLSSATKQYSIENMTNVPTCTNGELRPWALTTHQSKGYLGAVCDESDASNTDNEVSTDSRAFVLSFDLSDPTTGFTVELDIPLDYKNGGDSWQSWKTWSDDNSRVDRSHWFDEYNQAILGDIEFDENDTMYIAFINRFSMQGTYHNNRPVSEDTSADENVVGVSDLLRACYESNSTYSLEGTGTCTATNGDDGYFLYDKGGDGMKNLSGGALALLKGTKQLLHLAIDPFPGGDSDTKYQSTIGINTLSTIDGSIDNWYSILYGNPNDCDGDGTNEHSGYNAKGASLGDVELLTAPTPTEIGSRVWFDEDSDGIQDANESGIADVNVTLYAADGTFIATVQTDANGYYLFSNDPLGTDTSNAEYNLTELLVNSAYIVQIPNIKGINKQTELDGKVLTLTDVGEGSYTNVNDSDGAVSENDANASIVASEIAYSGANNHNVAFGFRPFSSTLTGHVYEDKDGDRVQNNADENLSNITVTAVDSNGVTHTTETNASGDYTFTDLSVGDANITIDESDDDFPTGAAQTEGRNPTTVTIVDGNNVEENNGFHLPIVTSITSDTQTEGTGNDLVHTVTMSASTSVDRNYTFNVVDNSTNGVNDYNLTYIFSDGVVDNGDGNISVPAGVSSFTVSVKVIDDDTAEDDEFYDITVGTVSATGTILDDDKGAIHGHVFEDSNGDGTQQFDEANLSGVDVIITDSNDVVTTVTTDANGSYSATDLQTGDATVDVNNSTLPANLTKQTAGTDPQTVTITSGGNSNAGEDGYQQPPASQVKAVIGNSVWYDENANGVQDAGESGMANVTVTLDDGNGNSITTVTDTEGGYLFNNLEAGTYSVTVTPPSGMNATYDEDATLDNVTSVTVAEGEKHLSADFGYNWVSPTDTTNPPTDATGAIGDRIWNDANGNGVQDAGESGIGGVIVTLMNDANKDGIYGGTGDTNVTATTDADGYYIFDDVARGAYVLEVNTSSLPANFATTPTGDPDSDGDNTSNPIPLAPGDVYLNGDFGYQPSDGSTIGDTIYLDVDADATQNGSEAGIAGVSVALLDDGSHIVATMFTDANGHYAFSGVQAGDYNVRVTDSHAIVSDFILTQDGGNTITVDGSADYLNQDFGYKLSNHSTGDGFIGDTVFLDRDGDDTLDAGEGLEGVTVKLYDEAGVIELYATVTDENGHYTFSGLSADHNYTVKVDTTTLPNSGTNLSNSVDPDGNTANESLVVLNASNSQIDLDQDFGYTASTANTLSGTLFKDSDTNGTLDASESERFENVTVVLLDDANHTVATTKTDANGDYSFTGLNDGNYTVYVSDDLGVMTGYWSTHGANDGADDNAQTTRYTVELTAGETDNTADFGFYKVGGTLGDRVWEDADADGIQDAGESGITDANVTLTITYPNGDTAIVKTVTDANGDYHFYNLMLDENFNSGTLPTYELTVSVSSTYEASPIEEGSDKEVDSSDPTGTSVTVVRGAEDESYDFGFYVIPDVIVGDVTVEEGDDLVFEVNLTSPSSQDINITLTTSDNTAKAGDDYNATTVTITISAGSTTGSVTVPTIEDTTDESDENMTLSVSSTEGGSVGDTTDTGTGTILDDDTVTVLTVSSDSVTEGTDLVHDVNLSGLADANRTYSFSITDNTTEGANDYNLTFVFSDGVVNNGDGTITVPTGVKDFTVTVESIDDTVDEDSEDYTITVGGVGATGTIEDNDAPPTVLTVTDDNVTEGEILEHNVTLSEVSEANTTYCFKIENNTTEDDDYNASDDNITFSEGVTYDENTGEITVPAGVLEFQVFVSSVQDENREEYEEFYDICIGEVNATGTITQEEDETILPITISYVYATSYGDSVDIEFATETEMGNVGFNIYAVKGTKWIKLNSELIMGHIDSFELQEYHVTVDVPKNLGTYTIGIAGVDFDTSEERHGPFRLGEQTGFKTVTEAIDWKKIKKEVALDRKMKTAMKKELRVTGDIKLEEQSIQLNVPENAVYRLEHEELLMLGIDLKRTEGNTIAISFKGEGVERHIGGLDRKGKWTVGSWIEFKGDKINSNDGRYLKTNTYELCVDESLVVESDGIEAVTSEEEVFENNNKLSSVNPSPDIFYDTYLLVKDMGQATLEREFDMEFVEGRVVDSLAIYIGTVTEAQHQVQILINGTEVTTEQVQGRKVWEIEIPIDDLSIINEGSNTLTIVAMGQDIGYDIYYYDKTVIHYENEMPLASKMSEVTITDKIVKSDIEVKEGTDYVMISHPLFMNDMLNHYITQRKSEGWGVQLVNVEDIYQAYGNGMATPEAIKSYLAEAAEKGVTHVQLVGAATVDYNDYLGAGSISFIPSIYVYTNPNTTHTPSDISFVVDEEGIAQMAIGRWPVRSLDELETVINKTLSWKSSGQAASHTALLIAGEDEGTTVHTKQMDGLGSKLEANGWNNTKIYIDVFVQENNGDLNAAVTDAREALLSTLNNGPTVTMFSGHSSFTKWSHDGLFRESDIAELSNNEKPTIALPLSCYSTYVENASSVTIAHELLTQGEQGAVAVYGSVLFSTYSQNSLVASKIMDYLLQGETLGEAILHTKQNLGSYYKDVILNGNLLGDVTLRLE